MIFALKTLHSFFFSYISFKVINKNWTTPLKHWINSCLIHFVCLVAKPLKAKQRGPLFSPTSCFISVALPDGTPPPPPFLTYKYLKLQLPCLGGCDVTGGISNVILVSRRDRSRKCLMNDEALCSDRPDVSRAARGGKGFLKRRSSLPAPGGGPRVHMNQMEVTISL